MILFLPPDVPLVRPPAAADPFRRAFVLLYRAVTHYAARGSTEALGEAQRAKITELRRALDEAKLAYQQHVPEPDLSDEQPGAREAVELLTALERTALDLPDAGNALDWLYTVDGDRFRAHLFANVLKLSRTGWPSLPLFTTAPPNYDFGFTETVREFDLPAVGSRPAQHWRELRIVAPDAADLTRLRSNQWNRYSSGGIYDTRIEDPTAEHERQRKWIDEQESFSRGVIEGRAWLADPERTADEIRKRWEHFHNLRMTKSAGSYPRDDYETRSQVDSPYYNALKAAEQRDAARAAANLAAARAALLSRGGALRALYQTVPGLAEYLAEQVATGAIRASDLASMVVVLAPVSRYRMVGHGYNVQGATTEQDEVIVRIPSAHGVHYFSAEPGEDTGKRELSVQEGTQLFKRGKPWEPPPYAETASEVQARLNAALPQAVRQVLRAHILGAYEGRQGTKTPNWVEWNLTERDGVWGVRKGSYSDWFLVDQDGHKLPVSSKKARAFLAATDAGKVEQLDSEAARQKVLSTAFDKAKQGHEPGVLFPLDLALPGWGNLNGYGVAAYTYPSQHGWDKPEKMPDRVVYAAPYGQGTVKWLVTERKGPKSPWVVPPGEGYYKDNILPRGSVGGYVFDRVGLGVHPFEHLPYEHPHRKKADEARHRITDKLWDWIKRAPRERMSDAAVQEWLGERAPEIQKAAAEIQHLLDEHEAERSRR